MVTFIQILHVILSIMLIGIILMQSSKGHGLSGAFGSFGGGAIQNAFGARTGDFLVKTTAYMTIIFFVSAFYLAYIQIMPGKSSSVLQNYKGVVSETPTKQAEEVGKKLGELTGDLLKKLKPSEEEPINKEIPPPPPPKNDSNVVKPLPVSQETSKEETLPAESSVPESAATTDSLPATPVIPKNIETAQPAMPQSTAPSADMAKVQESAQPLQTGEGKADSADSGK